MTPSLESLGIDKLSLEEKRRLAEALDEAIMREEGISFDLTDDQIRELERRRAEHEADPSSAISWEVFEAELVERYGL